MRKLLPFLFMVWSGCAFATTYYVGGTGASDSNAGTSSAPFATIQKAATTAASGDIVIIRAGTYRETIIPTNGGVTFESAPGEIVTISGLNDVGNSGWTTYAGQIQQKTISLGPKFTEYMSGFNENNLQYNNTQMLAQQIFRNNEMQIFAQFPNISGPSDLMNHTSQRNRGHTSAGAAGFGPTSLTDAGLTSANLESKLNGATIHVQGWFIKKTKTGITQNGNTITYGDTGDGGDHAYSFYYHITNDLDLLDQAGEWYYDGTTLYYWQPGGGEPMGLEYKARNWGFDLRSVSNISIRGLNFVGCDPVMTTSSSINITIDNIRAKYVNHGHLESNGGAGGLGYQDTPVQTGSKLLGAGSVLKNSEFDYSYGVMVWMGSGTQATNNKFTNCNYSGFYSAAIKLAYNGTNGSSNVKIMYNTFDKMGRAAIELEGVSEFVQHQSIEIGYNDFVRFGQLNTDMGAIYGSRGVNLGVLGSSSESRIHHNWFHNEGGFNDNGYQSRGINVNGVYFDQNAGPAVIDHNVHFNWGLGSLTRVDDYFSNYYTQTLWHEKNPDLIGPKSKHFNETWAAPAPGGNPQVYTVYYNDFEQIRNSIAKDKIHINYQFQALAGDVQFTRRHDQTPQPNFVGTGTGGGTDFALADTPANQANLIDKGEFYPPYTDGYLGTKPDLGAYEFGGPIWVPGYNAVPYSPSQPDPTTTLNDTQVGTGQNQFEYAGTGWGAGGSAGAYQNDEHFTATTNSYYQVRFTGGQIQVYAQKSNSQGIAAYSIDGGSETNVDHYNSTTQLNTLVYTSPALANGSHILKVRVTGTKNINSSANWLVADRVVITTPAPTATQALVELKFNVGAGVQPVNTGTAPSTFARSASTPLSSTQVPTLVGGSNSFDFGTSPGNYFVESSAAINQLKGLTDFTITGWLNCRVNTTGSGGNRIVSWINNGGDGVDLVYQSDGTLKLGVDAWPDASPAVSSTGKVSTNATAPASNWVFFAVTYSSAGQTKFYFGSNGTDASLDVTRNYTTQGPVGTNIGKLAIGAFNDASRNASTYDRMFRGLIDDIQIFGTSLSLTNIIAVQRSGDLTPPTAPTNFTTVSKTSTSIALTWTASSDNVGVTGYEVYNNGVIVATVGALTSYTLTGLTPGTSYALTIKAKDGANNLSLASNTLNETTNSVPSALIKLRLNESAGVAPVNAGSASSIFARSATTPASTANFPASVGAPNSFDFGTTPGNFYVESAGIINELKSLSSFTISGWLNCRSSTTGGGGNRVVSWINNGGDGVDLVYASDGSLRLGVDQWPDSSPAFSSANKVTTNASAPGSNWVFFAVTYSGSGQVQFYFGNDLSDASLDVTKTYSTQGSVGTNIGKLAIGAFNGATRGASTYDRMFRGLIDEIRIHGSVLSLQDIVYIQRATSGGGSARLAVTPETSLREPTPVTPEGPAQLYQNFPNPYTATTDIGMYLPHATKAAHLIINDAMGRVMKNIEVQQRGQTTISIHGNELATGMYFYSLMVDGKIVDTKRMARNR